MRITALLALITLILLLSSVFAGRDGRWDDPLNGDGGGVAALATEETTLELSKDEEVVLVHQASHGQELMRDGVVPKGGVSFSHGVCTLSCEFFYRKKSEKPACTKCRRLYSYSLEGTGRSSCYTYPQDFSNGQVTQKMVDDIYKGCRNKRKGNCYCKKKKAPKLRNIGLYETIGGRGGKVKNAAMY